MASPILEHAPHTLVVLVYGTPHPQGSKKVVGRPGGRPMIVDDNAAALRSWREDVKHAALAAMADTPGWERSYRAIIGAFTFGLPRPKAHYRTGQSTSHLLIERAPHHHAVKPDLDKLLRSTWDALTAAGAYADDARVCQVWADKLYVPAAELDRPGARIVLNGVRP